MAYGQGGRTDIPSPSWSDLIRPSQAAQDRDIVPLAILGSSPRMTKKGRVPVICDRPEGARRLRRIGPYTSRTGR